MRSGGGPLSLFISFVFWCLCRFRAEDETRQGGEGGSEPGRRLVPRQEQETALSRGRRPPDVAVPEGRASRLSRVAPPVRVGGASLHARPRRRPAHDAMAAAAETETAEVRVEYNVGQSYWDVSEDDGELGAGVEELTTQPCPVCCETGCGVKLVGSKVRGAGGARSCSGAPSATPSGR